MTNGLIIVSYKWLWYKETSEENLKPTTVDLVSLSQRSAVWKVLDNCDWKSPQLYPELQ